MMNEDTNQNEKQIAFFHRGFKKDKATELILRAICGILSIAILIGIIVFFAGEGFELWLDDDQNKDIRLTPSKDFGATSVSRLEKFYRSFGFVKNKDLKYKDTMVRYSK